MSTRSILVIGSKGHERATCLNWFEQFPNIEEYDSVIINLPSLSQDQYDKIEQKVKDLREPVSALVDTGREVFCIISDVLTPSPPPRSGKGFVSVAPIVIPHYQLSSNYNWLPSAIYIDNKKSGTNISLENNRFLNYFSNIDSWHYELYFKHENAPTDYLNQLYSIATNKSNKPIAGTLVRIIDRKKMLNNSPIGMVHLLPPPKEALIHQSIDCIIEIILGPKEKTEVPWRKNIDITIDHSAKEMLRNKQDELSKIQLEILEIQKQIKVYDNYRDLLTETGDNLERIVRKTLNDIGITTSPTQPGFPADLINNQVAVEITGIRDAVGADSKKITQIGRFVQNHRNGEKVLFIVNTYMNLPPEDRKGKPNFTPEMSAYLKALSVNYLTTQTLLDIWKKTVNGELEKDQAKRLLLDNIGEMTI